MSELPHKRVAVIGGGITGLAAAFHLLELAATRRISIEVRLLERGRRVGGALDTIRRDGLVIETGADSFLSEKPAATELAKRLGIESELISTNSRFRKTYIVRSGKLLEIPDGFSLMAPSRIGPFLASPLLSPLGRLRAALEPIIPARGDASDESLAAFVTRRMGREVLERIAQALAGGIYTADPEHLSIAATMPRFPEMERKYGSVVRGLRAANRNRAEQGDGTSGARWTLFQSFRAGMRTLTDAIASRLGECVRMGADVTELVPSQSAGWTMRLRDSSSAEADAVVLTAPAYESARMLASCSKLLSELLGGISYASAATVSLAYSTGDFVRPPETFGFVVPAIENRKIIACSFSSIKFAGRAPDGTILLRTFLGGALQREMMNLDDAAMIAAAREELAALLGVRAAPIVTEVRRWPDSMPQYAVGHLDRVAQIECETRGLRALALAGAAYRGVGIPDCIRSGELAAESVLSQLEAR